MRPAPSRRTVRCRIFGLDSGKAPAVILEEKGRRFRAVLLNPEVLRDDLPYGAEISVSIGNDDETGFPTAELHITESDRLPAGLKELLTRCSSTGFCLAYREDEDWRYLAVVSGEDGDLCLFGRLEFRGFTGFIRPPTERIPVRRRWLDRLHEAAPAFPLRIGTWLMPGDTSGSDEAYPEITSADLERGRRDELALDRAHDYYWSDRFDPGFYRLQARAGCIAVAADRGDRVFLLSQLQNAYAVLDWKDLHRSRSLARLFRQGKLEDLGARLVITRDVEPVLVALGERWGKKSWLYPEYCDLVRTLAREDRDGFALRAVELRVGHRKASLSPASSATPSGEPIRA